MWQHNHTLWVKFGTHDFKLLKLETNMNLNTKQTYLNDQNTVGIRKIENNHIETQRMNKLWEIKLN